MREFYIITIHPSFIEAYLNFGTLKSAIDKKVARITPMNLRDFAVDRHGTVDSRPFGGGDGMVMRPEPLAAAIKSLPERPYVILTSPQGKVWKQNDARRLQALARPIALICGRFGGVDERLISHYVDEEISLGDFVMSGGELAALAILDSILRLSPGVLGDQRSPELDSFTPAMAGLLEHPLYTKPEVFEGLSVPDVLRSGDHRKIEEWKKRESLAQTKKKRPDLL
ncbi:MAG: tRNA (guanosine(37)-N1)-methyltransferase TrmD [Deltaproteobacteria bacterium]|nr:tRNA (guanosine(37)-N1)-methyltransferase TrmD [Deltaproteobacteria bacterium]